MLLTVFLSALCGAAAVVGFLLIRQAVRARREKASMPPITKIMAIELERRRATSVRPFVILFFSETCPACNAQAPSFARVGEKLAEDADFVAIDIDINRSLANRLEVSKIPTLVVLRGKEPELARNVGVLDDEELEAFVLKATGASRSC